MADKVVRDPALKVLYPLKDLCAEKGVDESIVRGIQTAIEKIQDRDDYCEKVSSPASEALNTLYDSTMTHPFEEAFNAGKTKWKMSPRMMSGTLEGSFLRSLVSMANAKKALEIGMFTGYGALAMAEALPEDGQVITCEFDPYLDDVAKGFFANSPHGKKIQIRIAPAIDTLEVLAKEGQQFDIIFIDANKDGYADYYRSIRRNNLLAKRGTILFDNALMGGQPYSRDPAEIGKNGEAIKSCNEFLKSQDDIHRCLVPIRDGVLIVRLKDEVYGSA